MPCGVQRKINRLFKFGELRCMTFEIQLDKPNCSLGQTTLSTSNLFFEPLPKVDQVICMIEAENPDQNNFNFYNIPLNLSDALKLREYRRPYGL